MTQRLFEFCDQTWFASVFREAHLDALNLVTRSACEFLGANLLAFSQKAGRRDVLSLGSGNGVLIAQILESNEMRGTQTPRITLSDLYPDTQMYESLRREFGPEKIDYLPGKAPIDETIHHGPPALICFFLSFHHLPKEKAREALRTACDRKEGFLIGEITRNAPLSIAMTGAISFFAVLVAPFTARKFKISKLLISTLFPIVPITFAWDAMVSCLRSPTAENIRAMIPDSCAHTFAITETRKRLMPFIEATCLYAVRTSSDLVALGSQDGDEERGSRATPGDD